MRTFVIVMRPLEEGGDVRQIKQLANYYTMNQGGYHLFMIDGRIVRSVSSSHVIEVREV